MSMISYAESSAYSTAVIATQANSSLFPMSQARVLDEASQPGNSWMPMLAEVGSASHAIPDLMGRCVTMIADSLSQLRLVNSVGRTFERNFLLLILSNYELNGIEDIEQYLRRNSDLLDFLDCISGLLLGTEEITAVEMELYRDIDEGWEKLYIQARTHITDMDMMLDAEDRLYDNVFSPIADRLASRVVFSLRK